MFVLIAIIIIVRSLTIDFRKLFRTNDVSFKYFSPFHGIDLHTYRHV